MNEDNLNFLNLNLKSNEENSNKPYNPFKTGLSGLRERCVEQNRNKKPIPSSPLDGDYRDYDAYIWKSGKRELIITPTLITKDNVLQACANIDGIIYTAYHFLNDHKHLGHDILELCRYALSCWKEDNYRFQRIHKFTADEQKYSSYLSKDSHHLDVEELEQGTELLEPNWSVNKEYFTRFDLTPIKALNDILDEIRNSDPYYFYWSRNSDTVLHFNNMYTDLDSLTIEIPISVNKVSSSPLPILKFSSSKGVQITEEAISLFTDYSPYILNRLEQAVNNFNSMQVDRKDFCLYPFAELSKSLNNIITLSHVYRELIRFPEFNDYLHEFHTVYRDNNELNTPQMSDLLNLIDELYTDTFYFNMDIHSPAMWVDYSIFENFTENLVYSIQYITYPMRSRSYKITNCDFLYSGYARFQELKTQLWIYKAFIYNNYDSLRQRLAYLYPDANTNPDELVYKSIIGDDVHLPRLID